MRGPTSLPLSRKLLTIENDGSDVGQLSVDTVSGFLGYTPANKAGENFTGPITVSGQITGISDNTLASSTGYLGLIPANGIAYVYKNGTDSQFRIYNGAGNSYLMLGASSSFDVISPGGHGKLFTSQGGNQALMVGNPTPTNAKLHTRGDSAGYTYTVALTAQNVDNVSNIAEFRDSSASLVAYVDSYGRTYSTYDFRAPAVRTIDESSTFNVGKSYRTIIQTNNSNTILFDGGVNQPTYIRGYAGIYKVIIDDGGVGTDFGGVITQVKTGHLLNTIDSGSGGEGGFVFKTAGVNKWELYNNTGSDFRLYNYTAGNTAIVVDSATNSVGINGSLFVGGTSVTFTNNPALACGVITSVNASSNNNLTLDGGSSFEAGILLKNNGTLKYQIYTNGNDSSLRFWHNYQALDSIFIDSTGNISFKTPAGGALYSRSNQGIISRDTLNNAYSSFTGSTIILASGATPGYVWTCTNSNGSGVWLPSSGSDWNSLTNVPSAINLLSNLTNKSSGYIPYFNPSGTFNSTFISDFGKTLIDDSDAASARVTLGLGSLSSISGINPSSFMANNTTGFNNPSGITPKEARQLLRKNKYRLNYSATVNWDLDNGLFQDIVPSGTFTLNFPANVEEGETAFIYVYNNSSGTGQVSFASGYRAPGGISGIQLTPSGNKIDRLEFFFHQNASCTVTISKDIY